MKCLGKQIKPDDKNDCPNDAVGMFKTPKGNLPFCAAHAEWAKQRRLVIKPRDNYYGV